MIEYETFAYLGLQKTGSTFIIDFLQRFCSERCLWVEKHKPIPAERYSREKLYITSVRNPLDQYLSLYSYGVDGEGRLHRRLGNKGQDDLYDGTPRGFRRWLKMVLEPENATLLSRGYGMIDGGQLARILGYQSFQYLRLASREIEPAKDRDALRHSFERNNIIGFVIRNERLNSDLSDLVRHRLRDSFSDPDAALAYLENAERINASNRVDRDEAFELRDALKKRLQDREWLLHELFDY